MFRLRSKDLEDLSLITEVPEVVLQAMNAQDLINHSSALDLIVFHKYRILKNSKKYSVAQMVLALQNEYNVSQSTIKAIVNNTKKHVIRCSKCGKSISSPTRRKYEGLCKECFDIEAIKQIEL